MILEEDSDPGENTSFWHLDFGLVRSWAENPAVSYLDFWPTKIIELVNG